MNKIAVFGKPGGGKSTLARKLSELTGIPLHPLDLIQYQQNGEQVAPDVFTRAHAEILDTDRWIIDGLGSIESFWLRIDAADTLVYVDLPYPVHYWWVIKRLLKSLFVMPEGWPPGSSVLRGSLAGIKYLRLSPRFWNAALYTQIIQRSQHKTVYRITSVHAMNQFIRQMAHHRAS